MLKAASIVSLFFIFTSCFCQFVMDMDMKPDVTFGDQNERFDVASIIQEQDRIVNVDHKPQEYRRLGENENIAKVNENNATENKNDATEIENNATENMNDATENKNNTTEIENIATENMYDATENKKNATEIENNVTEDKYDATENKNNATEIENNATENMNDATENMNDATENKNIAREKESTATENKNDAKENENNATEIENHATEIENNAAENENARQKQAVAYQQFLKNVQDTVAKKIFTVLHSGGLEKNQPKTLKKQSVTLSPAEEFLKRSSFEEMVYNLHGGLVRGRRSMTADSEKEILFNYGVPVNMKLEGYLEVPLDKR